MSITDELRAWAKEHLSRSSILAIADRIDEEHFNALVGRSEIGVQAVLSDPEQYGLVALPRDADGEVIHIGDVMEWIDLDGEVTVTCSVDAVGVDCFFAWDKGNRRYAQKCANAYRHHHVPTVEDVLREFGKAWVEWEDGSPYDPIAKFAAKLRLAGDAS